MTTKDCECKICQTACSHKPGWFIPGEVEESAKFLGLSVNDFFKKYLGVDWWENSIKDIFVLAPATTRMQRGSEYPGNPKGKCVFFKNNKCEIHKVKPFECRDSMHDDDASTVYKRHQDIAMKWKQGPNQKIIIDLLGREPKSEEYNGCGF